MEKEHVFIKFNGKDLTLEEWSVEMDIPLPILERRLLAGEKLFEKEEVRPTDRTKVLEEK